MSEATATKKIAAEDLGVELIDKISKAPTVEAWKKKALAYAKAKGLEIVDANGNPVEATIVVNAVAPSAEELEADDENVEQKAEGEEDEEGVQTQKALVEAMVKAATVEMRRETDARIKAIQVVGPRNDAKGEGKHGFKNFGEYLGKVAEFGKRTSFDDRLTTKAPSTFANGNVGADGAHVIPPDFRAEIMQHMLDQPSIFARCRQLTTAGNSLEIPIDKTTPWGSDGLQAYWVDTDEAQAITESKPKLGKVTINLHELAVLAPVSNNLLEDAGVALESYITKSAASKILYKIDNAILNGTGAGQPLGIRNSGALKTVSRTTGTGLAIDEIADLIGAMPASAFASPGLTYLSHNTALPDVLKAKIGDSPIFTPVGTGETARAVPGKLYNIDLMVHEATQARDNAGDLGLHDFAQYLVVTKTTGLKADMSMHIYFDTNASAFRFIQRVGGQPWTDSTIAQDNGSGTVSPFAEIGAT